MPQKGAPGLPRERKEASLGSKRPLSEPKKANRGAPGPPQGHPKGPSGGTKRATSLQKTISDAPKARRRACKANKKNVKKPLVFTCRIDPGLPRETATEAKSRSTDPTRPSKRRKRAPRRRRKANGSASEGARRAPKASEAPKTLPGGPKSPPGEPRRYLRGGGPPLVRPPEL